MKYQSYLALVKKVSGCFQMLTDPQAFAREMAAAAAADPEGCAALSAAVGAKEIQEIQRPAAGKGLSAQQREGNLQTAQQLYVRLKGEGLGTYAALWAANCWANALAWPLCLISPAYQAQTDAMTAQELEALAAQGDGYAAARLAQMCEDSGDAQRAAFWRKAAYDSCDLTTMRWMERAAQEGDLPLERRGELAARHASLGDPQGLAAYALYLLEADPQGSWDKAFTLASLSASMDCPAGQYAMHKCLLDPRGLREEYAKRCPQNAQEIEAQIREDAQRYLEAARRGGYPADDFARAQEETEPEIMAEEPEAERETAPQTAHEESQAFAWTAGVPAPDWVKAAQTPQETAPQEPRSGMEEAPAAPQGGKAGWLFYCVGGVWDQVDQEAFDMTGEAVSDEVLVDTLLACLCGSMIAFEGDRQKKEAYDGLIREFGRRMPDFAEIGFDEAYLHERYGVIAGEMSGYRAAFSESGLPEGYRFEHAWDKMCEIECAAIYEVIRKRIAPSERAESSLTKAVSLMFRDLQMGPSEAD